MKKLSITLACGLLLFAGTLQAQGYKEKIGLPGDNLNLYAVLKVFQESPTLEEFENRLNSPDEIINNLDLNGDNRVDYIQVIDYAQGDRHDIVLRVAINRRESQDVAVISVLKDRYNGVSIQITGDPVLYGNNYIIEPNYYDDNDINARPNPGYTGSRISVGDMVININYTSGREIYSWPISRYLFSSYYTPWRSPWRWGYYPSYWTPWQPYYWDYYYGYQYNSLRYYLSNFRSWNNHRDPHWRDHYDKVRSASRSVIIRRDKGDYNRTYNQPDHRKAGDERFRRDNPRDRRDNNYDNRPGNNDRNDHNYNRPGNNDRNDHNYNRPDNNNKPEVKKGEPQRGSVIRRETTVIRTTPDVKRAEPNKGEVKREEAKKPQDRKAEVKKSEKKESTNNGRRSRERNKD